MYQYQFYIYIKPHLVYPAVQIKFEGTVTALGELVKEDVRLGTIFFLLVLVTPSPTASHTTRVSEYLILPL